MACNRKDIYAPFVGSGDFPAAPTLTPTGSVILFDGVDTVTLPSPTFGNIEELEKTRIQRKTRGGDLITYADSTWLTRKTFKMQFDNLSDALRSALETFISDNLGQPVTMTDHEDRVWTVLLIDPNGEYTTQRALCGRTAELVFRVIA